MGLKLKAALSLLLPLALASCERSAPLTVENAVSARTAKAEIAPEVETPGPYAVAPTADYDFGPMPGSEGTEPLRVRGAMTLPLGAAPSGGFPVLLFIHGQHNTCSTTGQPGGVEISVYDCESQGLVRIRSDRGYDYIAHLLAAHGYAVFSIDTGDVTFQADTISDIVLRARLLLHHLDIFRDIAGNPVSSYRRDRLDNDLGALFQTLDFSRVGLMGHSRGGNAASNAVTLNRDPGEDDAATAFDDPHAIAAVFALAPTDAENELPLNVAWTTLSPYCDGDVTTLNGVYVYDRLRYAAQNTAGTQHQITAMGANHNYYNDQWFNDDATDLVGARVGFSTADPYCGTLAPTSGRLSREDQRRHGAFLIASFLRRFVGDETKFAGYWHGVHRAPPGACPGGSGSCDESLHLSFHQPPHRRLLVDATLTADSLSRNERGPTTFSAAARRGHCMPRGGTLEDAVGRDAQALCPSPSTVSQAPQLYLQWAGSSPAVEFSVGDLDVSGYDVFSLRLGVSVTPENAQGQDFTLRLRDTGGREISVRASDVSAALYFPPGLTVSALNAGAKTLMNMVAFPLNAAELASAGVDLHHLSLIALSFEQRPAGTVQFTDLLFQRYDDVPVR